MFNQRNIIYWQNGAGASYWYGSQIVYHTEGYVSFQNDSFPSGTSIHTWRSQANYQAQRSTLQLPILKRGQQYHLQVDATVKPVETLYTQIVFFNRFNQVITRTTIKQRKGTFVYPEEAYHYEISLLSAGLQSMDFYSISINSDSYQETLFQEENGLLMSRPVFSTSNVTDLNIVFREPMHGYVEPLASRIVEHIGNVVEITCTRQTKKGYINPSNDQLILSWLQLIKINFDIKKMNLIGYGAISNQAALYFADKLEEEVTVNISGRYQHHENIRKIHIHVYRTNKLTSADSLENRKLLDKSIQLLSLK